MALQQCLAVLEKQQRKQMGLHACRRGFKRQSQGQENQRADGDTKDMPEA